MSAVMTITGVKELDAKLSMLKTSARNKIMRPAMQKAARAEAKAIKAAVPAQFKDAKKAIGSKVKIKGQHEVTAKAGAAVGIKRDKAAKLESRQKGKRSGRPGVGIGARNIHWFILGTGPRQTGSVQRRNKLQGKYRKSTGNAVHSTGRMPSQMHPVKTAAASSQGAIVSQMHRDIRERIEQLGKK